MHTHRGGITALWIVLLLSWAAEGVLGRYGLNLHPAAEITALVAMAVSVAVAVQLWRRIRRAERAGKVVWFESPELAHRVADLEARCAQSEETAAQVEALRRSLVAAFVHAGLPVPPGLEARCHLSVVGAESAR